MNVKQIYTGCLAHAAYYIESNGEAAVFDPLREVQPYLDMAAQDHAKITYIFETHFHADFVSGHIDLAKKSGASIVYGPTAKPGFEAVVARDGDVFKVGAYTVKAIHTPGHTMESTTYMLIDENQKEYGLITGDTLFIGDVGRPDLAQHVIADLTEDKLAGHLYDSLRNKIMPLSDSLIIYPNHGAGSACGKNMSNETTDTLGNQKKTNYALQADLSKEQFIKLILEGLAPPPQYFPSNVLMNIKGYDSIDAVFERALKPLSIEDVEKLRETDSILILDTRDASEFAKAHIPGSMNIGLNGSFAMWVGEVITDLKQKVVLVAEPGTEKEAVTRLSRVGYDYCIGYVDGGFESWKQAKKATQYVDRIGIESFETQYQQQVPVIDVRKRSEYNAQHVEGAINIPLNEIYKRMNEFPSTTKFLLHCAGGYRSMIAASILQMHGSYIFSELDGGYTAIKESQIPCSTYVAQASML